MEGALSRTTDLNLEHRMCQAYDLNFICLFFIDLFMQHMIRNQYFVSMTTFGHFPQKKSSDKPPHGGKFAKYRLVSNVDGCILVPGRPTIRAWPLCLQSAHHSLFERERR
jgi:hypothetical protein